MSGGGALGRRRRIPYKNDHGPRHDAPNSDINVTPLVDVCLVLLIIFMVVTPMIGRGREVKLPILVDATEHQEGNQVFVSVDNMGAWLGNDVFVDREPFLRQLSTELRSARGRAAANNDSGPLLFVKGDRDTNYARVKAVLEWINSDPNTQQVDLALVVGLEGEES